MRFAFALAAALTPAGSRQTPAVVSAASLRDLRISQLKSKPDILIFVFCWFHRVSWIFVMVGIQELSAMTHFKEFF
jgi:hypothetical protein